MAEAAKDEFARASGDLVVSEGGERGEVEIAGAANLRCVIDGIMFMKAERRVAGERVVRTMPVVLECRRALLEDLAAALWTQDVVAQAEVLV